MPRKADGIMTGVFISWTRENGRTRDLAQALDLEVEHVFSAGKFGLLGRYYRQFRQTRRILSSRRPRRLALMLPPTPALLALIGRLQPRTRLLVDAHTGFFLDPKWRWARNGSLRLIRMLGGTVIVTNSHLQGVCRTLRVPSIALHDIIVEDPPAPPSMHVLCPLSYANDEPVSALLEAARLTPDIEWVLTGRAPARVREAAPANVTFPGFVTQPEYDRLLRTSAAVVALTTRPHTMQRAGYEAFHAAVPQLTSDFPELREFYEDSARYTAASGPSIASELRALIEHRDELLQRLLTVRARRFEEQQRDLGRLRRLLATGRKRG